MLFLLSLRVELLMFLKLQITIICIEEYMLFVNYVLDLNNGFRAKLVVEESKDIYLEYMVYKSITMKCTKLRLKVIDEQSTMI